MTDDYPCTWVIREGIDAGKVAVQWGSRGQVFVVAEDGSVQRRLKLPYARVRRFDGGDGE